MVLRRGICALAVCLALGAGAAKAQFTAVPIASGFSQPTGFQFVDNNTFYVIEKATGRVKLWHSGVTSQVFDIAVNSNSERGLLGLALDPNYATNQRVYLYYSRSSTGSDTSVADQWLGNRLSSFQFNGSTLVNEQTVLDFPFDAAQSNGPNHNGGPLRFGPDGMLYGVIGDLNRAGIEQNSSAASSGAGGIYRIRPDGSIPDGSIGGETANPFAANADPSLRKWFAYGVRNSFGLAFDPQTNQLWDTENGPNSYDEVNVVAPGFNSGWLPIMGPDARDAQSQSDLVVIPNSHYSDPEFSWLSTIAPTSLVFLKGSNYGPGYDNGVLVGDNNTGNLYLLRLNAARDGFDLSGGLSDLVADSAAERDALLFLGGVGTTTGLQLAPDGRVVGLSLSTGTLYAVVPEPSTLALIAAAAIVVVGVALRRFGEGLSRRC